MASNSIKQHWEKIYQTKDTACEASWYQDVPKISIDLILSTGMNKSANIIDIGGGDSRLVDKLLELDFKNVFVLDVSTKALQNVKIRLGEKAKSVTWIDANILKFNTKLRFDIWHDRAVFHFFTKKEDIECYVAAVEKFVKPKGYLIISTFSVNGPKKCSGLDITQYSEHSAKKTFEEMFDHIKSFKEVHTTPFNTKQNFIYNIFKKR